MPRIAAIGLVLVLASAGTGEAVAQGVLDDIRGALDRAGGFLDRQFGVERAAPPRAGDAAPPAGQLEESPAPRISAAGRDAAAAKLREGLAARDRATTPAESEAAAAIVVAAAELGDPDAQYLLGAGELLLPAAERDPGRAVAWLASAAAQGHARAQFALARAYAAGDGVAREPAWADMWFTRAARRGHGLAQLELALRRIAGEGWPEDRAEAYRWLAIATAGGVAGADRYRAALGARLPPDQRRLLDAEAAGFRAVAGAEPWPDPALALFIQYALAALGFDPGPADGAFGPRSRAALARFAGGGTGAPTPALVAKLRGS